MSLASVPENPEWRDTYCVVNTPGGIQSQTHPKTAVAIGLSDNTGSRSRQRGAGLPRTPTAGNPRLGVAPVRPQYPRHPQGRAAALATEDGVGRGSGEPPASLLSFASARDTATNPSTDRAPSRAENGRCFRWEGDCCLHPGYERAA